MPVHVIVKLKEHSLNSLFEYGKDQFNSYIYGNISRNCDPVKLLLIR